LGITFEEFDEQAHYDLVIATQSLYYLKDKIASLKKIISLVSPRGFICITLWSKNCTLRKIFESIQNTTNDITAEEVYSTMVGMEGLRDVRINYFEGGVALDKWKATNNSLKGIFRIISRLGNVPENQLPEISIMKKCLNKYKNLELRINGVVTAVRV